MPTILSVRSTLLGAVLLGGLSACGPWFHPLNSRVSEDQQQAIDAGWNNLLSPPARADRRLLLEVLFQFDWYEVGVDHLRFRSEKHLETGGLVIMEVFYDRAHPEDDRFVVEVCDKGGNAVRRESYTRADVDATQLDLHNMLLTKWQEESEAAAPEDSPPLTADERARRQEYQQRRQAIIAATQPAGWQPAERPVAR